MPGGVKGEDSISELCLREGVAQSLSYSWSKEFLEAGKKRFAGDTARAATSTEVKDLRREARDLKEVVAEQAVELRLLSDNGCSYISGELAEWLENQEIDHVRGAPYRPQTQGKIEPLSADCVAIACWTMDALASEEPHFAGKLLPA